MKPMAALDKLSPKQLALTATLGCLAAAAGFLSPWPHHPVHNPLGIALLLVPILLGVTIWLIAISSLKKGIQSAVWPEAQIESLRSITESPLLTGLSLVLLGVFLVSAFPFTPHPAHPALREIGWASFLLGQCCSSLRLSSQRPRTPPTTRIDWHSRPPIQSDHWGER